MAREERGLLTPEEIRRLRTDLGLRQQDLEGILGVGPKTVTRWEKGTVFQSAVADKFMRQIWTHPEILADDVANAPSPQCSGRNFALDCFTPVAHEPRQPQAVDNDFALAA